MSDTSSGGPDEYADFREVADWPLLLVGPMVRRVEVDRAHVFLATKNSVDAHLKVWHATTGPPSGQPVHEGTPVALRQVGANLFVGVVAVDLDGTHDTAYSYDLILDEAGQQPQGLADLGLLGPAQSDAGTFMATSVPLGYSVGTLPSFITPPANIDDLRVAHASCRKAHGGDLGDEVDALPLLDQQLSLYFEEIDPHGYGHLTNAEQDRVFIDGWGRDVTPGEAWPGDAWPDAEPQRFHQLVLTGDQAYSDDVSPPMLTAYIDAAHKLLGYTEELPGIWEGYNDFFVHPGWRTKYLNAPGVKEFADVLHDYNNSHLLRFGEWCANYLFAWSDALWPRNPTGDKVVLPTANHRLGVGDWVADLDLDPLPWVSDHEPNRFTDQLTKPDIDLRKHDREVGVLWNGTREKAMSFGSTAPYARRLLANVATYTMFDDHEITDDWYLNRSVTERLMGLDTPFEAPDFDDDWWTRDVGPRILRNGLSAYAIFQHWGNVPEDFDGWETADPGNDGASVGATLLNYWAPGPDGRPRVVPLPTDSIPTLPEGPGEEPWWGYYVEPDEPDPPPATLPTALGHGTRPTATRDLDWLLRIDELPPQDGTQIVPRPPSTRAAFSRFRWDYAIDFGGHRLIALDTRTWRQFPTAPPQLNVPTTMAPADRTAAQQATVNALQDYAAEWQQAQSLSAQAYGSWVAAMTTLAQTTQAAVAADLVTFTTEFESWITNLTGAFVAQLDIAAPIAQLHADVAGVAGSGRPPTDTTEQKLLRASLMIRGISGQVELYLAHPGAEGLRRILVAHASYLEALALGSTHAAITATLTILNDLGTDLFTGPGAVFTPEQALEGGLALLLDSVATTLEQALAALPVLSRSDVFFRDGSGYLAAELISVPAMQFQLEDHLADPDMGGADRPTILLSPAPVLGNELVEFIQRLGVVGTTLSGGAGGETLDDEAWNSNPHGLERLLAALAPMSEVTVLSGDVHYANSSNNLITHPAGGHATCLVQLTSSAAKNSLGPTKAQGAIDDAMYFGPKPDGQVAGPTRNAMSKLRLLPFNARMAAMESPPPDGVAPDLMVWAEDHFHDTMEASCEAMAGPNQFAQCVADYQQVSTPQEFMRWYLRYSTDEILADLKQRAIDWWHQPIFLDWVAWYAWTTFRDGKRMLADPQRALLGHWLYARDVLLQEFVTLYQRHGIDPHYGVQVDRQILRDARDPRSTLYGARDRVKDETKDEVQYLHGVQVQTVGANNVGLVHWPRHADGRRGVVHHLLFHPYPDDPDNLDPGVFRGPQDVRRDWMGTWHETWFRHPPYLPPVSLTGPVPTS